MTGPLGEILTAAGPVDVSHRLALAVAPVDGVTGRATAAVRAVRETGRPVPRRRRGPAPAQARPGRLVLRHTGALRTRMVLRLDDRERRYAPRRLDLTLWSLAQVAACDPAPGRPASGPFVPVEARTVRPWLLPGAGYAVPSGVTGLRLRVVRGTEPVRWARIVAFRGGGVPIAWAHGDEHGQALLTVPDIGLAAAPDVARVDIALRVHGPDPAGPARPVPADPFDDLPLEPLALVPDGDVLRGRAIPAGYVPAPADHVRTLVVGELTTAADLPFFS